MLTDPIHRATSRFAPQVMVHKMVDAKSPRPLRSSIVASAHLAEQSQEFSELEYGIIVAGAALMRWMERYPDAVCSLTHGFPWRVFFDGAHMTLPDAIWTPFENPNLSLEVCFPVRLGDLIDFPYKEIWPTLAEMVEHIGADHLLWGTDMPFQNRFCTYRQSRDWIEKYDHGLSQDDLAMIMGGTAGRILEIGD